MGLCILKRDYMTVYEKLILSVRGGEDAASRFASLVVRSGWFLTALMLMAPVDLLAGEKPGNNRAAGLSSERTQVELKHLGVAVQKPGYHVWGTSPVRRPDGRIHLYVSEWPIDAYPKFSGWYKGCRIAHYVGEETLKGRTVYRGGAYGALERPQLLFDNGRPAYLYVATGVSPGEGYGSCSHIFRVVVQPRE